MIGKWCQLFFGLGLLEALCPGKMTPKCGQTWKVENHYGQHHIYWLDEHFKGGNVTQEDFEGLWDDFWVGMIIGLVGGK